MKFFETEFMNICMVERDGKVLVQHRIGHWKGVAFPGGHVDPGESVTDAMVRELLEETGLVAKTLRFCGLVHWVHVDGIQRNLIYCFRCDDFEGEAHDDPAEGRHEWVTREALKGMKLAPWLDEQMRMFEDDEVWECLYRYDDRSGKTEVKSVTWFGRPA